MNDDKARQRLGRGLASLIGGSASSGVPSRSGGAFPLPSMARAEEASGGERRVPVGELSPNPKNPRRAFGEAELAELTASIRQHGVVQPILVRRTPGGATRFEIVAGERRWRAAQGAGLGEVPVVLREISDRESLEIAIIENVQRADLNAIEEALGYEMLMAEYGYTQSDLGDVLGKSRSHVANTLRLLKLPASVKAMVQEGTLSAGAARTAVAQPDPEVFARRIVEGGLSVREAETMARAASAPAPAVEPPAATSEARAASEPGTASRAKAGSTAPSGLPKPAPTKDGDTQALERLLTEALGLSVGIDLRGEGGTMHLNFRNLDQLDEICRLLQTRRGGGDSGPRVRSL
ncbi:ParB/RepB/Spo0J family partition protein [Aureimonas sp. AU12]|uniref:ParB/RepB/Spo0J family partition protein n=1 Tax=Aureimonas sp. AU12 TaxID=1638161 RepID=UPI000781BDEA|nr:ParB/RepB/Spo0J family partition protein [Aureimonas sp. AU12]